MKICNRVHEIFNTISLQLLAVASQKLVSQILLPYKSLYTNHDIFYDKVVLICFMDTIVMPHVKRLCDVLEHLILFPQKILSARVL